MATDRIPGLRRARRGVDRVRTTIFPSARLHDALSHLALGRSMSWSSYATEQLARAVGHPEWA